MKKILRLLKEVIFGAALGIGLTVIAYAALLFVMYYSMGEKAIEGMLSDTTVMEAVAIVLAVLGAIVYPLSEE